MYVSLRQYMYVSLRQYMYVSLRQYMYVSLRQYMYVSLRQYMYVSLRQYMYVSLRQYMYVSLRQYMYVSLRQYMYVSFRQYMYVSLRQYMFVSLRYSSPLIMIYMYIVSYPELDIRNQTIFLHKCLEFRKFQSFQNFHEVIDGVIFIVFNAFKEANLALTKRDCICNLAWLVLFSMKPHLSFSMWNAQGTLVDPAQQWCQCTTVPCHCLWGWLQLLHPLHTAVHQGGELWGQGHWDTAQAPGCWQPGCWTGVDENRHYWLNNAWKWMQKIPEKVKDVLWAKVFAAIHNLLVFISKFSNPSG